MNPSWIRSLFLAGIASALPSCSNSSAGSGAEVAIETRGAFTAEDKRIAKRLSVSEGANQGGESPQRRALACSVAIATLEERVGTTDIFTQDQRATLTRLKDTFYRRATVNLSQDQISILRREVDEVYSDQSAKARLAIGCIRDFKE